MVDQDRNHIVSRLEKDKDPIVNPIITAHDSHLFAMNKIRQILDKKKISTVWRYDLRGIIPDTFDLVIAIGGDGTVLHASHAIGETAVLAINSSTKTSVGYFTAGNADNFETVLDKALENELPVNRLYRMEVKVNGEVVNSRVLNDVLFCHECPASTTRYIICHNKKSEDQMSSGVWISTAAGSTAAIKAAGGIPMGANTQKIQYKVREPGPGGGSRGLIFPKMVSGIIDTNDIFYIRSRTVSARLYIDGPHVVIPVNFGDIVTFTGGSPPINILGDLIKNKA
jgi:NAD+ kinase